MAGRSFRLALLAATLLLVLAIGGVTVSAILAEYLRDTDMERAIPWSLGNAQVWRRTARVSSLSLNDQALEAGAGYYRQSLARNPFDVLAWQGLVTMETRLGGDRRAEPVLRGWNAAMPNSPRAASQARVTQACV